MTPGFTMSTRTRPMVISKFVEYIGDKGVIIKSKRLIEEMKVFIWRNGRAEAQPGYNDDLVMSFAIGMYIRDTALRFKDQGLELTKKALNNMTVNRIGTNSTSPYSRGSDNPYHMNNGMVGKEDFRWLC